MRHSAVWWLRMLLVVTAPLCWQASLYAQSSLARPGFPKALLERTGPVGPALPPGMAPAPAPITPPKVYALIIGHGRDRDIGAGVQISGRRLETLLQRAFPATNNELVLRCVGFPTGQMGPDASDGQAFNVANIDSAIASVSSTVNPEIDTVVCFVLAHGSFDSNRYTPEYEYGHYFGTEQGGYYPRSTLVERLKAASPKLTVVISDSCNVKNDLPPSAPAPAMAAAPLQIAQLEALRTLLLEHTGVVSLNASSPGQFSFYSQSQGGYFIQAIDSTLSYCRDDISWHEFFALVSAETAEVFRAGFAPYGGCPYAWDPVRRQVLTLTPSDPRTQKVLQPFASRPLTLVAQDEVHVEGGTPPMCPCPPPAASTAPLSESTSAPTTSTTPVVP